MGTRKTYNGAIVIGSLIQPHLLPLYLLQWVRCGWNLVIGILAWSEVVSTENDSKGPYGAKIPSP